MKFLDLPALENINTYMSSVDVGDRVLNGRVEAYTFKPVREDRRVLKDLERQYSSEVGSSQSPIGSMKLPSTRKLLSHLIVTLNSSFPDYDFSEAGPEDFAHVGSYLQAVQTINRHVVDSIEKVQGGFKSAFWNTIDDTIELNSCEVYHYNPDIDSDVFCIGRLFSLNFFFINRRLRRLLFFTSDSVSKLHADTQAGVEATSFEMEESRPPSEAERDMDRTDADDLECGSASSWMGEVDLISPSSGMV